MSHTLGAVLNAMTLYGSPEVVLCAYSVAFGLGVITWLVNFDHQIGQRFVPDSALPDHSRISLLLLPLSTAMPSTCAHTHTRTQATCLMHTASHLGIN